MKVGFNYQAWNTYGLQIGPYTGANDPTWDAERDGLSGKRPPKFPLPPLFNNLSRNLSELRSIGISVVRWFLLGNGVVYGKAARRTVIQEDGQPKTIWRFTPPLAIDPRFAFHFREMLSVFRTAKMQLIPSLVDYQLAGDSEAPDPNGLAYGGRADCIRMQSVRSQFINGILLDLVLVAREFKDVIYAVEVMNEPIWTLLPPVSDKLPIWDRAKKNLDKGNPVLRWPIVSAGELSDFLTEAISVIKLNDLPSTVGHRFYNDLQFLPVGDLPQFHYYAKNLNISGFSTGDPSTIPEFKGNPAPFLGEFASDKAHADQNQPWPDLGKSNTTLDRLKFLESKGCPLCLIWPDLDGKGLQDCSPLYPGGPTKCDPLKLHPETIAQIKTYTGH
ncbi:MAG TPA: hypothetical protein VMO00_15810 [Methylomirabilota bacterium]|nr:hypothetical protein [Methylomirabilota bacterium]